MTKPLAEFKAVELEEIARVLAEAAKCRAIAGDAIEKATRSKEIPASDIMTALRFKREAGLIQNAADIFEELAARKGRAAA